MENVLYKEEISTVSGNFIWTTKPIEFEKKLIKENIPITGLTNIQTGHKTDFHKWFSEPIVYKGILEENGHNALIFLLGEDEYNLFDSEIKTYYDLTYIINKCNDRIGKSYKAGTFRDCFLKKDINNNYYWK